MKRIGETFKEKVANQPLAYIMILGFAIIMALVWTNYASSFKENCNGCVALLINAVFLILLALGTVILFWKIYKKESDAKDKSNDFNRKIDWEEFQNELNKEEREWNKNYDRLERIINKLEPKKWESAEDLRKSIDGLDKKLSSLENTAGLFEKKMLVSFLTQDFKKKNNNDNQ